MEMLFAHIRNESGKVRKSLGIDGERSILVLVVNVEVEHVGRNLVGAQTVRDFPHLRFGNIAISGLLKSQRPKRRQRRRSRQVGVAFQHLFRGWPIEHVVIKRATFSAECNRVASLLAEIKPGAPGVIEKDSVTAGTADAQKKRNAFVKRINRFLGSDVGVPERVGLFPAIEAASLVAQAEVMFVGWHLFENGKGTKVELHRPAHGLAGKTLDGKMANDDAQGTALHPDLEFRSTETRGGGVLERLHVDRFAAWAGKDCPRSILRESTWRNPQANDVIAKSSNP